MQPWQRATEEVLQGKRESAKIALASVGLGLKGSAVLRGINALLKPGVSSTLAMEGMSKLNPYIKKFGELAKKFGYSDDDVVDHMRETNENQPSEAPLFRRLTGEIDFSKLDDRTLKELSFLERIASQLEASGKTEKDYPVKSLKKKIDKALQGMTGIIQSEAMTMEPMQEESQMMGNQNQGQPGPGAQALMTILQQIQSQRGQGG